MDQQELVRTMRMVWPAALSSVAFALVEFVDAGMLGLAGINAFAGGTLGATVIFLVMAFPLYMLRAMTPIGASSENDKHGDLLRLTILAPLTLGICAAAVVGAIAIMLPKFGYAPALADNARLYLLWRSPFLPLELMFLSCWNVLEGLTDTRRPLPAGFMMVGSQVLVNLLLIPGFFGLPKLGVMGAALGSGLGTVAGLCVIGLSLGRILPFRSLRQLPANVARWREDPLIGRFIQIGWPFGLAGLLDVAGWLIIGILIPRMGPSSAAIHAVISQLVTLGLASAQGVGIAATVLVAQEMGSRDSSSVRRHVTSLLGMQASLWLLVGTVVLTGNTLWANLFTSDLQVIESTSTFLPACVVIIGLEGMAIVLAGAVEGTGRTRILLASTAIFDVLLGIGGLLIWPDRSIGGFYQVWVCKSALKIAFLGLVVYRSRTPSRPSLAFLTQLLLLPPRGDLFGSPVWVDASASTLGPRQAEPVGAESL